MLRNKYFDYIQKHLSLLTLQIKDRGKLNILNLHVQSENFFTLLLNHIFDWELHNLNTLQQNVKGVDLIDDNRKILVQVSATNTKQKIDYSLQKAVQQKYTNYNFKFLSIACDATELRKKTYNVPSDINFDPNTDIIDIQSILKYLLTLKVGKLKIIYEFIKEELGEEVNIIRLDSNLAEIINILSLEKWNEIEENPDVKSFEIAKKISFNNLVATKLIIDDYAIHYNRLDQKYKEFDNQGVNKSYSVLQFIRRSYIINCVKNFNADELFLKIIEEIKSTIVNSANYKEIPIDELDLSVNILVVDAFIRCKIFNNPEAYCYVTS